MKEFFLRKLVTNKTSQRIILAGGLATIAVPGAIACTDQSPQPTVATPQTSPSPESTQSPRARQVEFPYENRGSITLEEFNNQLDLIYEQAIKETPQSFQDTGIFYSANEDQILVSRRNGQFILAPLPGEPQVETPNSFKEVIVNNKSWYQPRERQTFPGRFEQTQAHYLMPDGYKPRVSLSARSEDNGTMASSESRVEMNQEDLFKLAKALTESFNWAVQNNKFHPLNNSQTPKTTPVSPPKRIEPIPLAPLNQPGPKTF